MIWKVEVIGTGSKGNAYILYFENDKQIQLDAGLKNKDAKNIDKVFITHSHKDHNKYIKDFNESQIILPTKEPRFNDWWESFYVCHAELNNGYVIERDGEQIVYLTDIGRWYEIDRKFPKATLLIIECNWDAFRIKYGILKKSAYSEYVFSDGGHMSNLDCLNLIDQLNIPASCKIIFVHKSDHHSVKETFEIFKCLPQQWCVAENNQTIYITKEKMSII